MQHFIAHDKHVSTITNICTRCLKNVTSVIVNNFYTLELILIIFGTLYAETTDF